MKMGNFCMMWARIQEKGRKLTQNYSFTAQIINVLLSDSCKCFNKNMSITFLLLNPWEPIMSTSCYCNLNLTVVINIMMLTICTEPRTYIYIIILHYGYQLKMIIRLNVTNHLVIIIKCRLKC